MLILGRKTGEAIVIGDHDCLIEVTVLDVFVWDAELQTTRHISNAHVRLGITAPEDIPVDRLEIRQAKVFEAIQREKQQ